MCCFRCFDDCRKMKLILVASDLRGLSNGLTFTHVGGCVEYGGEKRSPAVRR